MSDYQLTGIEQILNALEARLGEANMRRVTSKALRTIAKDHVAPEVEAMARSFVDKGNTVRQIVVGNVSFADYNIPKIKVGWKRSDPGDSPRWNIEHLNEMGFTRNGKFYRPRGFGKLQGVIDDFGEQYPRLAREELKELVE
ncbi:hypothetical protein [Streptococcus suis]|uniref:HK97 gp10 family phage protein n=1 Tax=Streptococcus suis TaxID=1307 RepID=A0A0Z8EUV9_STRSU|nr:hypothetical protein [Streptococcus suis]NQH22546.1 hypothetical protein [Streptococcus suis]NQN39174.1 hypothetical protein [Streptococcus suis]NQP21739.1 hypothetical protein [Streptococcus suis]CYU68533.1 Uncharacterised protein [Streptococcus suis]